VNVDNSRLDHLRESQGEIANHVIDEFVAGRLSRRDLLRRGALVGISMPVLSGIIAACSSSPSPSGTGSSPTGGANATIRAGILTPTGAINPVTVADQGGLDMLGQTGQYLVLSTQTLTPKPVLAESWSPNSTSDVWTFKIRQNVKFHNGQPLTADDVVYTFQQQVDPKNASNALSAFSGILSPSGVVKVDPMTVALHLETPIGNFPYLVSLDTYNAVIVPKGTDFAKWQSTFIGTGPFKLKSYTQNVGAQFVANPDYWGPKALLSGTQFTFYANQEAPFVGLQGGTVDMVTVFTANGAEAILNNPSYTIVALKSSSQEQLSMRNDLAPFTDPRVRQAVAVTLDRPALVKALIAGYGTIGNDNPFSPIFPSTDTNVPQRTQNLTKAKQLLDAAGHPSGFHTELFTGISQELPLLAQAIAADAAKIGITISLKVETLSVYYGKSTFGNSDWLDGTMSLVNYAGRGVPNVFLEAPLTTHGVWNAARFHNPQCDALVKQYVAAIDLQTQKQIAGKIQTLLLAETPIVIPYFIDELNATKSNVHGVYGSQVGQLFLGDAYMTA